MSKENEKTEQENKDNQTNFQPDNNNDGSDGFTSKELNNLEFLQDIRLDALKEMTKEGPVTDTRKLRLLNEVASSVSGDIKSTAEVRIKHKDTENNAAARKDIAEILKQTARKKKEFANDNPEQEVILDETYELPDSDIVDGETSIEYTELDPEDFIPRRNDDDS